MLFTQFPGPTPPLSRVRTYVYIGREELFPTAVTVFVFFLQACQGLLLSGFSGWLPDILLLCWVLSSSCFVFLSSCCHVTRWLGDVSLVGHSPSRRDSCVTVVSMYCITCVLIVNLLLTGWSRCGQMATTACVPARRVLASGYSGDYFAHVPRSTFLF